MRGYTRHAGFTEAVEHDIPRLGVVEDVAHDGLVRHLGVIGVRVVDRVVLALAYIDPRVRAGGVVRRIAQIQNVLVAADGKAFDLAKLRVAQSFAEEFRKVLASRFITGEFDTETDDRWRFQVLGFVFRGVQLDLFHKCETSFILAGANRYTRLQSS